MIEYLYMEVQSRIIFAKFEALKSVCLLADKYKTLLTKIENLECKYMIVVTPIFCDNKKFSDFTSAIKSNNILGALSDIFNEISRDYNTNAIRVKKPILQQIKSIMDSYPKESLSHNECDSYDICPSCSCTMQVDKAKISYFCNECGVIKELVGVNFNEQNTGMIIKQKQNKTGRCGKHFTKWWQKILALEPDRELGNAKDIDNQNGEKTIAAIKKLIARDHKKIRTLTVNDIRQILAELGLNCLYEHTSLILYKITGISPPIVSDELTQKVSDIFSRVLEISEEIRLENELNQKYYPYYIMKILDAILPEDDENRKILFYIYVQKKETIEKNDDEWFIICERLNDSEIKYKPTERDFTLKYI